MKDDEKYSLIKGFFNLNKDAVIEIDNREQKVIESVQIDLVDNIVLIKLDDFWRRGEEK